MMPEENDGRTLTAAEAAIEISLGITRARADFLAFLPVVLKSLEQTLRPDEKVTAEEQWDTVYRLVKTVYEMMVVVPSVDIVPSEC